MSQEHERECNDWIDTFVEYTDRSEAPRLYRLWTAISCVGAALQRKCYLRWGYLTFYPNMYVVLVGPSGARKGTALGPGYELLSECGIRMSAQSTTLQALIRRLKEANAQEQDLETGRTILHSSMTIFSEELTVFIGYQQRELMAALCDWYDCKSRWIYDTKNMGTDEILGVWVNLMGATTPHLIQTTLPMDSIGGGLTSRIVFVYEHGKERVNPRPFLTQNELNFRDSLRNDLEKITLMRGSFTYTDAFVDRWEQWYRHADLHPPKHLTDERFAGYRERRPTHLMKLSMIVSASESADMYVDERHIERAIRILEITERKMHLTFSGVGRSPVSDLIPRVAIFVAEKESVLQAELMQRFYYDADDQTLERIVRTLEKMGYVQRKFEAGTISLIYTGPEDLKMKGI